MSGVRPEWWRFAALLALCAGLFAVCDAAHAISIELKDVASDRIERQRAHEAGRLPLADTPDVSRLDARLAEAGVKSGSPLLMRVFKASSELELWIEKDKRFILFATYPICHWSGTLGPKLQEGDKQTPEGFYTITQRQTRHLGRWRSAINLGFPNAFDRAQGRNGSFILMHGGCSSVGCFAMTDPVMREIHELTKAAIERGQRHVPIHVFPFRMTERTLAAHAGHEWHPFWTTLKAGYDSFERTRRPPRISVCKREYYIEDAGAETALAAPPPSRRERNRRRSRFQSDAGGPGSIRVACPKPVVAEVDVNAKDHVKTGEARPASDAQLATQ